MNSDILPSSLRVDGAGPRLLLVEDDRTLAMSLGRWLRREGYDVTAVHRGFDALTRLQAERYDIMLLDIGLPDCNGWDILRSLEWRERMPVTLAMTGVAQFEDAVRALRLGAIDYIPKPTNLDELSARLHRALNSSTVQRSMSQRLIRGDEPICVSPTMAKTFHLAARAARAPSTSVLILGESGVGKEVLAEYIHRHSDRANKPFVRINLAAMPMTMIEAELFGTVRGAFTGAQHNRGGLFAAADGGTLLLDELCEFDVGLQAKLLRVLETRSYFPVGSDTERSVDVRVLAATNRDPLMAIAQGRLREDLYYRLAAVSLVVPPLRDRPEDILPLACRFLARFSADLQRGELQLAPAAERALRSYPWPGNVRELRNTMERAAVMALAEVIDCETLGLATSLGVEPSSEPDTTLTSFEPEPERVREHELEPELIGSSRPAKDSVELRFTNENSLQSVKREAIELVEKAAIRRAIHRTAGNLTHAAEMLGVSRSTLWSKLHRYNMSAES